MSYLLEDIGIYLKAQNVITNIGTDYFIDVIPDTPKNLIKATELEDLDNFMDQAYTRHIKFLIRNTDHKSSITKAIAIYNTLKMPSSNDTNYPARVINGRSCICQSHFHPRFSFFKDDLYYSLWECVITTVGDS